MSYSEFNVRVIWIVFPVDAVYLVEWYLFYIKYCRYLFCRSNCRVVDFFTDSVFIISVG